MHVDIEGKKYEFYWKHRQQSDIKCEHCGVVSGTAPGLTQCFVNYIDGRKHEPVPTAPGGEDTFVGGVAFCAVGDRYVKEVGRLISLNRAAIELADKIVHDKGILFADASKERLRKSIVSQINKAYFDRKTKKPAQVAAA